MAQNLLYLPPGVVAPAQAVHPAPPGVPFDRAFFENVLPQAVHAFSGQADCQMPIVEVTTIDGVSHFVRGVAGVGDAWVALHVSQKEHERPVEMFLPYQTIFRIEISPCSETQPRRLGFVLGEGKGGGA